MIVQFDKATIREENGYHWLSLRVTDEPAARKAVYEIKEGKPMDADLHPHREKRSLDANAYCWVLLGKLSEKLGIPNYEIYRNLIKDVPGASEIMPIRNDAVNNWVKVWCSRGIGWQCENLGESKKIKGYSVVMCYYGSSTYDLVRSGFANDLSDVSQIYWIINNAGGMTEEDKAKFRQDLLYRHMATADGDSGVEIKPYTQEIPYQARKEYLTSIRSGIYEDFGGLDVHTIAAGATNDHIDAAYQPLDENADDFEYQIIECVQQLLALQGISGAEATPTFKRNRISNQKEQVEIVMMEAPYLDDETILNKLPNISPDEVDVIMKRKEDEGTAALATQTEE